VKLLLAVAENAARWHEALARCLPEATIARWPDERPREVDYAAVWKPDPEAFRRVAVQRAIFNLGAGVDALLEVETLPPDVPIVRLEDAGMAAQMAEYAVLSVLREFRDADHYVRANRAGHWSPQRPRDRRTFGIGVMGAGVLAQAVLAALQPFGFPLATWSRMPHALPGVESYAGIERLPSFLARSKMLIGLLPSTPQTRDLLDADALALLPSGAHIVNLGRGDLIVDSALIAALNRGHIAHATLDVFREEPLPPKHPFWHHSAITVTPHVSAVTRIADAVAQVAAKVRTLERGEMVTGVVDRAKGY